MAIKSISALSVTAMQAVITAQVALSFYYVPKSLAVRNDPLYGPTLTAQFADFGLNLGWTLTAYNTEALAIAAITASNCGDAELVAGNLGVIGNQFMVMRNLAVEAVGSSNRMQVLVGAPVALTTATPANLASLSLNPGRWLSAGTFNFLLTGATSTVIKAAINTTTATLPAADGVCSLDVGTTTLNGTVSLPAILPNGQLGLAAATTAYAVASATFSAGTIGVYGLINFTRVQ